MQQDFYSQLFVDIPSPPLSPLGPKPQELSPRIQEAKRLSELMRKQKGFCFLRLGDMELAYLLAAQEGHLSSVLFGDGFVSGTIPQGNPGIGAGYVQRLQQAFEQGDYVDFHERVYPMEYWLPHLKLPRPAHLQCNPDRETSYLSLTWLEFEFKRYCEGRRIGIAGAEASLLKKLSKNAVWRELAHPWWPETGEVFFHQVRDDGRNLDQNLDLVKADLATFIDTHQLDTLFLSLGGGAKILCYELSREHNICAFDFGAMLRALTYSACDGNRAARSTHAPFLFRLPFDIFMDALEQAFPNLTAEERLAKAHAQLLLEIQCKEVGWTHSAYEYDFSENNRRCFHEAYRSYKLRYRSLEEASPIAKRERQNFLHFCGTHRLTLEGRIFYLKFILKSFFRNSLKVLSPIKNS